MSQRIRKYEQGVTALVVVMFSVLLFVTVTLGFMKLMINEVSRTNDNELSQGAYDSALAGVEDGKRLLAACDNGDTTACDKIDAMRCDTTSAAGLVAATNGEVYLKTSTSDVTGQAFEQAYTCLKIIRNTPTYEGASLAAGSSTVIALTTTGGFTDLIVRWRVPQALSSALGSNLTDVKLPTLAGWNYATPAVLRTQLIQFDTAPIDPTVFDNNGYGHTLYLMPKSGGLNAYAFASDGRRSGTLAPKTVACGTLPIYNGYNCEARLTLPRQVGGAGGSKAYLRLTSLYNSSAFQIVPSGTQFSNIQPIIDSTGRASDVFRRVSARVEKIDPAADSLYPRATVDVTNNLCKTMTVSTLPVYFQDHSANGCTP
jgi:hypothetical protein